MMKEWDIEKIKAVILYILNNMSESRRDVYHIVKAAYYAQQYHFVRYATRLYPDDIKALTFGPVPSLIYDILKAARGEISPYRFRDDRLIARLVATIEYKDEWFYANQQPDMGCLSKSNVECLDDAIATVSEMGFGEIVDRTHGKEWHRAYSSVDHTMSDIAIAQEGGADSDLIEYLSETLENDKIFS